MSAFSNVCCNYYCSFFCFTFANDRLLQTMSKMSPRSLKVTLRQVQEGRRQKGDLKAGLQMEYGVVLRCMQANDFREGIRALLVDRDNSPAWSPATLQEVTQAQVDQYFTPLPANELLL